MTTPAPAPLREDERLAALRCYNVLDTPAEKDFDDLALLASRICGTPMALVSLVAEGRQWFKARVSVEAKETPREMAFCAHALSRADVLIVPDATADERFSSNPLVTGPPHIRFYAGAPLLTPDGHALGTLCVLDRMPRQLTPEQIEALRALSHEVVAQLELRRTKTDLERLVADSKTAEQALRESEEFKTRLIDCSRDCIKVLDLDGRLLSMNVGGMQVMEICDFAPLVNSVWTEFWKGEYRGTAIAAVEKAKAGGVARFVGECATMMGNARWWDVSVSPIFDSHGQIQRVLSVSRDITETMRFERTLATVAEATAAVTGEEFFSTLVRNLAVTLGVRYAFVTECIGAAKKRARSLAFWSGDNFGENFEYDTEPTPCQKVLDGSICHYPRELQSLFPGDVPLVAMQAQSFLGVPAYDSAGDVVGHLAIIDDKIMPGDSRVNAIMKIFAARAGAELERQKVDRKLRETLAELQALKNRLHAENIYLQEEIRREHNFEEMVGNSPAILSVLQKVEQVASTDATVLLLGETGVGKELIARAIHDRSARKERPLVKVNCGAIPAGLVESELFGHVKGAFTGALEQREGRFKLADGGTLFLDEVSELPLEAQVKLLRVLQEQEFEPVGSGRTIRVDVRIIAATNRGLNDAIRGGRFRDDLFYRLNVFPLEVPSLRERRSDIPQLAAYFLARSAKRFGKPVTKISQGTMELLKAYNWPGNIRELQNIIERGVVLSQGSTLSLDGDLFAVSFPSATGIQPLERPAAKPAPTVSAPLALGSLEEVERNHILAALEESGGMIEGARGAASVLKLHPNTLRSRMQKLGIKRTRPTGT